MALKYEYRPAKAVQRRMVISALSRLSFVAPLDSYRYVGFGALEFIDFSAFHRGLGIDRMISIERDLYQKDRYTFNAPYRGVEVIMGEAHSILPTLDWAPLSIIWLDYTEKLTREIVTDVDIVTRFAQPGSVVIATVCAEPARPVDTRTLELQDFLKDYAPTGLDDDDLGGWGLATVQRAVLQDVASTVAKDAHGGTLRQLFNFNYADGARMQTWGGVITSAALERPLDGCRFDELAYVRGGEEACRVAVPVLTTKEASLIEEQLPRGLGMVKVPGVSSADVDDYIKVHRWHRMRAGDPS